MFLLKLGKVKMVGKSATSARLPSALIDHIPTDFKVEEVIGFRPLHVTTNGEALRVHVLGDPPATFDSAFSDGELVVRAPGIDTGGSFGAGSIAAAIRELAPYPLPEELMVSLVATDKPPLSQWAESAVAEPDYAQSFVAVYRRQKKEVRRAFLLAARLGPARLNGIAEACARGTSGIGNPSVPFAFGIFFLSIGMLFAMGMVHDSAVGYQMEHGLRMPLDVSTVIFVLAAVVPLLLCFGSWLLWRWWSDKRERQLECRLFEEGGGFGGSLDALLALLAWDKEWRARVEWNEMEMALVSNPQFALNLCEVLRGMKEEKRRAFVMAAPPGLREKLIGKMLAFEGVVSPSVTLRYFAVWLPCFALGIYGTAGGLRPGPPLIGDWLVSIFGLLPGFGGVAMAVVLLVIQIRARRHRRWAKMVFRAEESETR